MYPNQYCNPCNEPEPCVPAPPPPDCVGEPCEEIVLDTCVRYTGPAIPCLGILTGASLNQVIQIIAERLCDCCDGTPPVIDCEVSEWSEWGPCIDGYQTRTRTVIQAPQNGGEECPPLEETRECCTPVNCVVSEWGEWSECNDGGMRTRTRTVITPASCDGTPCPVLQEVEECSVLVECGTIDPSWVTFGTWDCPSIGYNYSITVPSSATWATGSDLFVNVQKTGTSEVLIQSTYQFSPTISSSSSFWTFNSPFGGGQMDAVNVPAGTSVTLTLRIKCNEEMIQQTYTYIVPECPVEPTDCVVSEWSEWSECVEGIQTRSRTVITPASGEGVACPELSESRDCENPTCPVPTNLTATILE